MPKRIVVKDIDGAVIGLEDAVEIDVAQVIRGSVKEIRSTSELRGSERKRGGKRYVRISFSLELDCDADLNISGLKKVANAGVFGLIEGASRKATGLRRTA